MLTEVRGEAVRLDYPPQRGAKAVALDHLGRVQHDNGAGPVILKNILTDACIYRGVERLGKLDRRPNAEGMSFSHVAEAVELKEDLRREDVGFAVEQLGGFDVERFVAIFDQGVHRTLPRQEAVTGLVQPHEALPHRHQCLVEEDEASGGMKQAHDLVDSALERNSTLLDRRAQLGDEAGLRTSSLTSCTLATAMI